MIFGVGSPLAPGLLLIHARDSQGTAGHSLARSSGPAGAPQAELGVTSMGFWDPNCGWSLLEHPTVEQHSKHSKKPTKPRVLLFHGLPPSLPSLGLGGWQAWQGAGHPQPLSTGTGSWCAQRDQVLLAQLSSALLGFLLLCPVPVSHSNQDHLTNKGSQN